MKKVVITGATGMIGVSLVNQLVSNGIFCLLLVKKEYIKPNTLPVSDLCKVEECDLHDLEKFDYKDKDFDVFIHLGWMSTIGLGRDDAFLQEKNIKVSLDAVALAKKLGCNKFVGVGSQAEYGVTNSILSPELSCNPQSGYGIAKYSAGKLTRILANKLGISHCWIRILSVYGPNDNPNTLISYLINCLKNNIAPTLTPCEQIWDYIYVDDCSKAIISICEKGVDKKTYLIASGEPKRLKEYVLIVKNAINPTMRVVFGGKNYPKNQPMFLKADISELKKDTGFTPCISFEEGIKRTIKYMEKQNDN